MAPAATTPSTEILQTIAMLVIYHYRAVQRSKITHSNACSLFAIGRERELHSASALRVLRLINSDEMVLDLAQTRM